MPSYNYKCEKCEHVFEATHGMNEEYSGKCPECNSKKVKKTISRLLGIHFKGQGWTQISK